MRATAEIDEFSLPVERDRFVARNARDDLGLVFLADAAEEFDGLVAIPDFTLDRLVAVHDLLHALLDRREVILGKRLLARKVVIETVLDGRANRHLRLGPEFLDGLGQDVGCVVAQQFDAVIGVAHDDFDRGVLVDFAGQVPQVAVHAHCDGRARQPLADACCDGGARNGVVVLSVGPVR